MKLAKHNVAPETPEATQHIAEANRGELMMIIGAVFCYLFGLIMGTCIGCFLHGRF